MDFKAPHILQTHLNLRRLLVEGFLAAMAAMPSQLKVTTIEGGVLTLEVMPANTIEELKAMLREKKHCEDPIERQILKIKVLAGRLLVGDDQTLESAGLLHAESEVTVIYCRNEVEAATKEEIHAESLLQVKIPSYLKETPLGAFEGCNQVVKVVIPESVTAIRVLAFANCNSLASITIPESVTTIGRSAFANCCSLKSITIPESETKMVIENHAFLGCISLESITIPESVRSIGNFAFDGCKSLASITIPESVRIIGEGTFRNCSSLASIRIPGSVLDIGKHAFQGCKSLESINLHEGLWEDGERWSIGEDAFEGCSSLASITIPEFLIDDWKAMSGLDRLPWANAVRLEPERSKEKSGETQKS